MVEVSIDFETYSECDIKAGVWKYSEHPSTEILCLKYSIGNQQPREYKHGDSKEVLNDLFDLIKSGCKLRAWNANFERAIWENVAVKKLGWVNVAVEQWIDDMAMAAYYAYPLSLKRCGDALKLEQEHLKDTKGVFLLNKFSKPRKPTKNNPSERTLPTDDPNAYQDLLNYCRQDVKSQQAIVAGLPKQHLPEHEQEAWTLDSKINSNGILIDLKMAQGAIKLLAKHEENLLQELRILTDGEVQTAKQRDKFLNWLRNNGCDIEDLQKATISNYLSDESLRSNLSEKALKGLQIRQELGLASVAKYKAIIASACEDGRVRGTLQFLGATRTGRFAGRLIQIQNFPRGKHLEDKEIEKIQQADYDYFKDKGASVTKVISNGLRQAIIAPNGKQLGIADYSSIENRVLAWYANDNKSLEDFRTGADQYKVMAASLFNVKYEDVTPEQRFTGKVIILGCFAEDTIVVTNNGNKKIVDVTIHDKLWDGVEWVQHEGLIEQGVKGVIDLCGVKVTPEHGILTSQGWREAQTLVQEENSHILKSALELANSQLQNMYSAKEEALKKSSAYAPAGIKLKTSLQTFSEEKAQDAMFVQNKNQLKPISKIKKGLRRFLKTAKMLVATELSMLKSNQLLKLNALDVVHNTLKKVIRYVKTISIAEIVKLGINTPIFHYQLENYSKTCGQELNQNRTTLKKVLRYARGGKMSRISTKMYKNWMDTIKNQFLTEQTTLGTIAQKIAGLSHTQKATTTQVETYDIKMAGKRNRYTIVTPNGHLIVHNCGYSMSGKTFHSHANGVFGMDLSLEHAEMYVAKYRKTYNKNVKLWRDLDTAAKQALRNVGKAFAVGEKPNGRVIYKVIGNNLYCRLPSGRNLCYPEAKLVNENGRDQITFKAEIMQKWVTSRTYGGKLCENICQATSRDLLIEALKSLDNSGYKTVAHVHDEILCELEPNQSLEEQIEIMVQQPTWAETLPLKAEGFISSRYKK